MFDLLRLSQVAGVRVRLLEFRVLVMFWSYPSFSSRCDHHHHILHIQYTIFISIAIFTAIFFFVTPYPSLLAEKKQKYFVSCFYLKSDSRFRFVLVLQSKGKEEERVERREKKKREQKVKGKEKKEKKRKQKEKGSNRLLFLFLCCFQLYSRL